MSRRAHRRLQLRNRRWGCFGLLIAAAVGLCSSEALALDPEKPVARYRLRAWTAAVDPPPTPTAALAQTGDGHLWIASHLGLIRFDGFHKRMVMPPSEVITSLASDRAGNLWIGSEHGLSRLDAGATTPVTTSLAGTRIVAVVADDDGAWAGTGSTVYRVTGSAATVVGDFSGAVTRLAHDGPNLWVATSEGMTRQTLGSSARKTFKTDQGLLSNSVQDVLVGGRNDIWVGTGAGLNRIIEGEVSSYRGRDDLDDGPVTVLYGDREKNIWVGVGERGLYRFANNRFEHLGSRAGLSSPRVTALAEDHEGGLWIGSAEGTLDRLDDPPVFAPPPVQFRGLLFDGVPAANSPGQPLTIPASVHTVGVEFSAPRFSNRTGVAFRHRLVGFDPDWREVGDRNQVNYSGLPAGSYTFELMTSLSGGPWESVGGTQVWVREGAATGSRFGWLLWCVVGGLLTGIGMTLVQVVRTRKAPPQPRQQPSANPRQPPVNPLQAGQELPPQPVSPGEGQPSELSWLEPQAVELARCLGAMAIKVLAVSDDGHLQSLAGRGVRVPLPSREEVNDSARSGELVERSGNTLLGLRSGEGDVLGAILVCGRGAPWDVEEQRLLAAFSRQLTATLEMHKLQAHQDLLQTQRREAQQASARGDEQLKMCTACRRCYPHTARRCGYDGGRLKPLSTPYRFHDRYTLSRFLGQGGMGRVFEARDERLDREVAIKIIRGEHLRDETVQMRLVQEAKTVARISHPGVIALYDFGELSDGSTYLVMEKLKGSDLADLLATYGPARPDQVAWVLRQGAAALTAAHRAAVIHRDIKPENIFIIPGDAGFAIKILDFGLAKSTALDNLTLTQTGMVMGTPMYMSPEQLMGWELTPSSDMYSFACVCYELLTGHRVVEVEGYTRICAEVLYQQPKPPSHWLPGLPEAIDRAFLAALQKDLAARPEDLETWVAGLAGALEAVPSEYGGWPDDPHEFSAPLPALPESALINVPTDTDAYERQSSS